MEPHVEWQSPDPAKTAAEIAKLKAETECARNDSLLKVAEARKATAEAEQEELKLRGQQRDEKSALAADQHHHVYAFTDAVSSGTVRACIRQLTEWHRNDPGCNIEIVFNSPGGEVIAGMALYDFIQTLRVAGHYITTTALGMAASMAGILLQAGDARVMGAQAWLLIHEASFGAVGKIGEVEDTVEWVKRIQKRILRIFAARSNMTERQIANRWSRRDWWIDSDHALEMGFIDAIQGDAAKPKRRKK